MNVKTSELTGPALDWAVANCEGWEAGKYMMSPEIRKNAYGDVIGIKVPFDREFMWFNPSTNWAQGGPIIEREIGNLWKHNKLDPNEPDVWTAAAYLKAPDGTMLYYEDGPTPLIAAMRCYVASELGNEVEVPEELLA